MGFFGKLFEKKECAICGAEIGLLGNRKLEDGNMCKNCAKLLSPWFSDRRQSTVEQIKEQLAYREANKAKVAAFHTTRTLGDRMKVLLDEDAGRFIVTDERDLAAANPDVMAFSDVTGCILDINESRTEIMREDREGKQVSYNPPRYTYSYNFTIIINVRNPYFDEIRFKLNLFSVDVESQALQRVPTIGGGLFSGGLAMGFNPENSVEYSRYKRMGEEIREALLRVRQEARDSAAASAAEEARMAAPWVCPACGGQNNGGGKFCEFCGAPRPQ